jgi:hypothetical protein
MCDSLEKKNGFPPIWEADHDPGYTQASTRPAVLADYQGWAWDWACVPEHAWIIRDTYRLVKIM